MRYWVFKIIESIWLLLQRNHFKLTLLDKSKEFNPSPFLNLKKDFSFILPKNVKVGDLINSIKSSNDIIGEVLVFDIYNNIENKDKRFSVGVEVEILQKDKVYNAKEINEIMHNIILKVKKEVNGELRV